MRNGPAPFSDVGKRARDLLTKDYNFHQKFTLFMTSGNGLGLTANGVKVDQLFTGDIASRYKSGNTTVDVKLDTNSTVATTVTVDELVAGMKTTLSFKIPDDKSGKLDLQYLHKQAAINTSVGLVPAPTLDFAATIGTRELSMGAEVGFDSSTAAVTKYNVGVGFNQHDFSASLLLVDKGQTLKASYIHIINPLSGDSVAAEMTHRLTTEDNSFIVGSSHLITPFTMVKTRISNSGKIGVLCQQEWRPKSLVTLSAEYDPKSLTSPSRVGLALALK